MKHNYLYNVFKLTYVRKVTLYTVEEDPGFPVGGGGAQTLVRGCQPLRGRFLARMYVKTKELGPVVGRGRRKRLYVDPPLYCNLLTYQVPSIETGQDRTIHEETKKAMDTNVWKRLLVWNHQLTLSIGFQ